MVVSCGSGTVRHLVKTMDDREIHLAEYKQLKDEQCARIGFRDNLIYVTFTALAAVVVFVFAGTTVRYPALLLAPPACLVLGWTYLANDRKISEIGDYIRTELTPRLADPRSSGVLGWESKHRTGPHRRRRKALQAVVDLTAFCLTGVSAVVAYWATEPIVTSFLMVVGFVEIALVMYLGVEIVRYEETRRN